MVHLFHEEVFPLPLFSLPPLFNKSESLLKISRMLGQEILCRFAKTWNGCSGWAFRTFRQALRTIGGFSINRKCDSCTHFRKKYIYRQCNNGGSVFKVEAVAAPSICTFHNLSSAPITHRGDFLWWNLCQMFAYNASFSDVTIPAALNSLMKIQCWLVTSWFRDVIFVTRRRLCVIGFLQGGIRGVPPAALLLLGQRTVKITRGQLDCVGCKCCVKANLWFTRPLNFTLRHKILVLRRIEEW